MTKASMHLDEKLLGTHFTVNDPNTQYTLVGFGQNDSFIVFGSDNDIPNNRFKVKSFKLVDVTFLGQFP